MQCQHNSRLDTHLLSTDNNEDIMDESMQTQDMDVGHEGQEEEVATDKPKSLVQLYAQRVERLAELKSKIAGYSTAVITHPEINMNRLRDLLAMFDIKADDPEFGLVFFSIQKMVALAALEVFRDILPNYRLKEKINEEEDEQNSRKKNFQLKKQTKRLREYEKSLIQLYRLYLNRLQRMVDAVSAGKAAKKSNFYEEMLSSQKARHRLATIGIKCMSQLVLSHPHFNFRQQLVEAIVQMMANNRHKDLADMCCQTVERIYRTDKLGEISLEAVKLTAKLVKQRDYRLDPKVLKTLLSLRIKEVKQKEELNKKDMRKMRIRLNLMSRKDRKRNKRMQKLDNQLLETEAQESQLRKLDFHTQILNQIFVTYFRVLKHQKELMFGDNSQLTDDHKWFKALLTPVLEGLSKFAQLINVEFFFDLISLLYELIRDKHLDSHQTLHCLHTVFTILSREGHALNIDFQRFYSELYVKLAEFGATADAADVEILLSCLNTMIIKRKKQMTHNRVLGFIKRLSTVSLHTLYGPSVALLAVVRQIMLNHKQSDILLDSETVGVGSGVFMPEVDEPEHCNANATQLWELTALTRHYEPLVRQFAQHIINGSKGNEVPIQVLKREPSELFHITNNSFNDFEFFAQNNHNFNPKKKMKINYSFVNLNTSLTSKCYQYLQHLDE